MMKISRLRHIRHVLLAALFCRCIANGESSLDDLHVFVCVLTGEILFSICLGSVYRRLVTVPPSNPDVAGGITSRVEVFAIVRSSSRRRRVLLLATLLLASPSASVSTKPDEGSDKNGEAWQVVQRRRQASRPGGPALVQRQRQGQTSGGDQQVRQVSTSVGRQEVQQEHQGPTAGRGVEQEHQAPTAGGRQEVQQERQASRDIDQEVEQGHQASTEIDQEVEQGRQERAGSDPIRLPVVDFDQWLCGTQLLVNCHESVGVAAFI